ncbi:MAG: 3-deoxy-manno-octulosonate cytidylyltransferase [Ilumatobacteraceae bacterium]|nr:3-deoxy-manno-octulosonate cytidylyltransferase [Ilumatobacteraceae bacterium]
MTSPLRVGVLTFHRCINHGSYWQARCLVDGLRGRGHDVELLDHHSDRVNVAEWRCALRPTLPTPVPRADHRPYRDKLEKFRTACAALPMSPRFDLDDPHGVGEYDTVVVGSDEVWNLAHPWYGGSPLFFGTGLRATRVVSYAASFGSYDASAGLDPAWAGQLRRFAAISVRDDNSRDIVGAALGTEPPVVLDPTLQFPPVAEGTWSGLDGPFVAVYGHNFSEAFIRQVRRWAQLRGRRLVSISYRNDWADEQWLQAGPHDFAHAIANADAVITNFFHGCVFALLNDQSFVCEPSRYRHNKIRCLMSSIGGEHHLVSEDAPATVYDELLDRPLDPAFHDAIARLRSSSNTYLDAALP